MTAFELLGAWVAIFLTLSILSFLYEDNPVYKLAEHLFLGVSIGISITEIYYGTFKPNLVDKLVSGQWLALFQGALIVLLFFKLSRKNAWLARIPIAFLVASYAGVKLTGEANANLMTQVAESMPDLAGTWTAHGFWDWQADGAGVISDVVLVAGLLACLAHFYFGEAPALLRSHGLRIAAAVALAGTGIAWLGADSLAAGPRGLVALLAGACAAFPVLAFSQWNRWVVRFGVLTLMLSFGASFGYTVMGRISLAIGRAQVLLGLDRSPEEAAQVRPRLASIGLGMLIVGLLWAWKRREGRGGCGGSGGATGTQRESA